jgi:phage gpG-like protein
MSLQVEFELTPKTKRWLKKYPSEFELAFYKALRKAMFYAERKAKVSFGTAGKPNVRTGHLRRSIQSDVRKKYDSLVGILFSDVVYAAVQEYGATIKPRVKDFLRFQVNGDFVYTRQVIIPARPFLGPALQDNLTTIQQIVRDEIVEQMNRPEGT